jgi:hypothetical protein
MSRFSKHWRNRLECSRWDSIFGVGQTHGVASLWPRIPPRERIKFPFPIEWKPAFRNPCVRLAARFRSHFHFRWRCTSLTDTNEFFSFYIISTWIWKVNCIINFTIESNLILLKKSQKKWKSIILTSTRIGVHCWVYVSPLKCTNTDDGLAKCPSVANGFTRSTRRNDWLFYILLYNNRCNYF